MGLKCFWCYDPATSEQEKLCPQCKAVSEGPRFTCPQPLHGVSLWYWCVTCHYEEQARTTQQELNRERLESLLVIRRKIIENIKRPSREVNVIHFMSGIVGQSVDGALDELIPIYGKDYIETRKREAYEEAVSAK